MQVAATSAGKPPTPTPTTTTTTAAAAPATATATATPLPLRLLLLLPLPLPLLLLLLLLCTATATTTGAYRRKHTKLLAHLYEDPSQVWQRGVNHMSHKTYISPNEIQIPGCEAATTAHVKTS